jgi:diaminohydroxyphosphoribosylaminopyrimidine deaminase / 5-amino-6-(5-phosphoribosylamino)uracil reductase
MTTINSSIFIEGGATTLQHFIDAGLYDTVYRFVGANSLGEGIEAPRFGGYMVEIVKVDGDEMGVYIRS